MLHPHLYMFCVLEKNQGRHWQIVVLQSHGYYRSSVYLLQACPWMIDFDWKLFSRNHYKGPLWELATVHSPHSNQAIELRKLLFTIIDQVWKCVESLTTMCTSLKFRRDGSSEIWWCVEVILHTRLHCALFFKLCKKKESDFWRLHFWRVSSKWTFVSVGCLTQKHVDIA